MKKITLRKVRPGAPDSLARVGTTYSYTYKTASYDNALKRARLALVRDIREENPLDWQVVNPSEEIAALNELIAA